jgi:hypothetical protein
MITITGYHVRQNQEGKQFIVLELQGDVELIQSSASGKFYATAKKCTMPSTFPEEVAKTLVGKQLKGRIEKVQTDEYEYANPETGEVLTLAHTFVYVPEEKAETLLPKKEPSLVGV